uniref:DNA gyrase subunit A n=1 Tax=uncultured marine group II/III euryarchaeote KM3_195_B08 TaxID=1457970 RepID=A0A075GSM7_9EURY|nr:DNA gyrase subunit A (gyrA) [uncultured marine group II/III euryarchaeote KM3_195_B08]
MEKIIDEPIENDMKNSYLDYAMSVIVGRALPDVRDGLKPVHRRILYTMHLTSNLHNKPYKKCARIVGDCLGRFHPHGDTAIYDSLVRMAQDFSLRYMLVDGQGNFGSIDGDSQAAMRYTECRMKLISEEMLTDIQKETVSFVPNFDASLKEPTVLPSKIPNLLMNGSSGIAVGMATNIPPYNLGELIDALICLIDGEDKDTILSKIKGPDFPTGGLIVGRSGIHLAHTTGRGKLKVRGRCEIDREKNEIIITEIPYQVTKTLIIEKIVHGVKEKKIEGIRGVHDHSDKDGIRLVVELKRGENPEIALNQLYKYTPLQTTFGVINLVLVNNQPKLLDLHSILNEFLKFRKEIVTKRCEFELRQAEARAHILEGLKTALENVDSIVELLKKSKDTKDAQEQLMITYSLSDKQSKAILDMKLSKLISLEQQKLVDEYNGLVDEIKGLKEILADMNKVLSIIKEELTEIRARYGDNRRTDIIEAEDDIELEELIPNDRVVVTITNKGYIKRLEVDEYRKQRRGGKGVIGTGTKEEDFVRDVIVTKNHNYMLFFTDKGRVFWLKTYRIPEAGRYSTGRTLVNLLNIKDEKVTSWISVDSFDPNAYFVMATRNGIIKRISLEAFSRPRKGGIIAITLKEGDGLVDVLKSNGSQEVILATKFGQAIRFKETDARELGRTGQGVIGIRLKNKDDGVVGMAISREPTLITITENGYGKRTAIQEYRVQSRGGSGVINIKTEGRNGSVVGVRAVKDGYDAILITSKGQVIRIPVSGVSVIGRNTQGVRLMRLAEKEKVVSFAIVRSEEPKENNTEENNNQENDVEKKPEENNEENIEDNNSEEKEIKEENKEESN